MTVRRSGVEQLIHSSDLVPSDVVILDNARKSEPFQIPCDLILLDGKCVINESNLTGESIPVIKVPIDSSSTDNYDPENDAFKKHTLYGGSMLLQSDKGTKALVSKTGF